MEQEPKPAVPLDSLLIDCRELSPYLVDLEAGATVGMRTEQEGFDLAMSEVLSNQAKYGALAGVTEADVQTLKDATAKIERIDHHLPAARKAVEVMEETRAWLDDQRQRTLSAIASSVEYRAKAHHKKELLAKYENVRNYRSQAADKAWRTRQRNQAQAENNPEQPGNSSQAPSSSQNSTKGG